MTDSGGGGLSVLAADISRTWEYQTGGSLQRFVACCRAPGVHAVIVYRFGQSIRSWPLLLRIVLEPVYYLGNGLIKILWGIELPRAVRAGPGLYIGHFGGITISPDAEIGKNCNLSQGITIGIGGHGNRLGVPKLGDNVYVAPGARLFGQISIGNGAKIGANAVIYRDLPDDAIAVLDPGFKILERKR